MKLFQQLMLAPAALGLVAPLAAQANGLDLASSTNAINTYTQQQDLDRFRAWEAQNQVTSINQFADVQPTSWAYQALSNLIERYGCVAGYPNGTFKGGQAMTRFEAAALLNACLDRVTETTDELQRLLNDFQKELAVIRGRVDGLEKKVGKLEAQQFSTTTKLQGDSVFVLGANAFGGNQNNRFIPTAGRFNGANSNGTAANGAIGGATVFNYDLRLNFLTSFTGKDLLYTRLRSGNFVGSPYSPSGGLPNLLTLDRAFGSGTSGAGANQNNIVQLDRLYYRFPVGKDFTALVGPRARNTEFLAITPSFYKSDLLDIFTLHGAPGVYNKATGAVAGLMYKQKVKKGKPFFAISTSYVAPDAYNGSPTETEPLNGGIFNDTSAGSWTTQLGVAAPQWALTFGWRYGQCGQNFRRGTQFANQNEPCGPTNSGVKTSAYSNNFALNAAWQPKQGGTIVPSLSLGWGYSALTQSNLLRNQVPSYNSAANIAAAQSWTVALQWADAFAKGNAAGMAVGQPQFVTSLRNGQGAQDQNYAWEWWYKFQVSDNISITPAIYYLSRPYGQYTQPGRSNDVFGGLIQTQFRF